jgi:hypothetical protein
MPFKKGVLGREREGREEEREEEREGGRREGAGLLVGLVGTDSVESMREKTGSFGEERERERQGEEIE